MLALAILALSGHAMDLKGVMEGAFPQYNEPSLSPNLQLREEGAFAVFDGGVIVFSTSLIREERARLRTKVLGGLGLGYGLTRAGLRVLASFYGRRAGPVPVVSLVLGRTKDVADLGIESQDPDPNSSSMSSR